jgi:hypothetical protein
MERRLTMKKLLAMLLACMMLLSSFAFAEGLEMSDIPNMTAPGVLPIVLEELEVTFAFVQNTTVTDFEDNKWTNWLEENTGINISFGGTTIIIVVGVALDTVRQLESEMMMRHYKGFLE